MSIKTFTIAAAMLACAVPAAAQERGTVEFGIFGSAGKFDKTLTLDRGVGVGGHVGVYLDPRWAIEFEKGEMKVQRTLGLRDVNLGTLSARLVATPIKSGAFSMFIGAGAGASNETNFMHTYGYNAMAGVKVALSNTAALRAEYINDWYANYDRKTAQAVHVMLSFYRHPNVDVRTVESVRTVNTTTAAAPYVQRDDSVSAAETRRLREQDAAYRALRDSLARRPIAPLVSAADQTTMSDRIMFEFDRSDLSPAAKAILDDKVTVFRNNPTLKIEITGHTDAMGTDAYNLALGVRRAEAAREYLIAKGVDGSRIMIDSKGESQPSSRTMPGAVGIEQNAPNRRGIFTLILQAEPVKKP